MENPTSPELVVLNAPASPRAEAFRVLWTRLARSDGGAPRSLLITSPTAQENRHAVAVNLALVMAEADEAVVVVDADLHAPRLQQLLGLADSPGLVQCLQSGALAEGCLQPGPLAQLSALTAGGEVEVSAPLLARPALSALVAEMTAQGRTAVIVGPPVLPSADAGLLSGHVDGVVLVVGAYRTTRSAVRDALSRLEGVEARILGAVLDNAGGA